MKPDLGEQQAALAPAAGLLYYIHRCRPADTIAVALSFRQRGLDCCCPSSLVSVRRHRRAKAKVSRMFPLIAGYVFIADIDTFDLTRGLATRVKFGEILATISGDELVAMAERLTNTPSLCYNAAMADQTPPTVGEVLAATAGATEEMPEWRRILLELTHGKETSSPER